MQRFNLEIQAQCEKDKIKINILTKDSWESVWELRLSNVQKEEFSNKIFFERCPALSAWHTLRNLTPTDTREKISTCSLYRLWKKILFKMRASIQLKIKFRPNAINWEGHINKVYLWSLRVKFVKKVSWFKVQLLIDCII